MANSLLAPIAEVQRLGKASSARAQVLLALVRVAYADQQGRLDLASLVKWYKGLPAELGEFFDSGFEEIRANFKEALGQNISGLPDLANTAEFLALQLLLDEDAKTSKARGAVFTPTWLARRVTRNALAHWGRFHRNRGLPTVVGDLSCGPGAFLSCLNSESDGSFRIVGADIDPTSALYSKALAHAMRGNWDVRCQDSLLAEAHHDDLFSAAKNGNKPTQFDLLVGNPPYVRSQLLTPSYTNLVRAHYPSTRTGNFDLSVAFIENAIERLTDGGIASYILTNKFMTSAYGRLICERLAREVRVLGVEDYQDSQIFPGYITYTCVLTFAKVAPTKRFIVTRFPGGLEDTGELGRGQSASLPAERLECHPWDFATDRAHDALRLLRDERHPLLDSVFGPIVQGLRTGSNQVFVVDEHIAQNLEPNILLPFISGEHIRRGQLSKTDSRLIYPYRRTDFGTVELRSQADLQKNFPKTWEYLSEHRSLLEERSCDANSPWFAYSRSQNLDIGSLRKLLVREMMPRAEFAADFAGEVTFASGYALDASRLNDADLRLWTVVMCTPTMEFVLRQNGTQLHSGWFRLLKHHLRRVRLPQFSGAQHTKAVGLAKDFFKHTSNNSILKKLDDIVAESFGLNDSHRTAIAALLTEAHSRSITTADPNAVENVQEASEKEQATSKYEPVRLEKYDRLHRDRPDLRRAVTFVPNKVVPVHRWYKYTQAFSQELVAALFQELKVTPADLVLDPFLGCGTTCVTARHNGIPSVGLEISPLMILVAKAKAHPWKAPELRRLLAKFEPPTARDVRKPKSNPSLGMFADYLAKAYSPAILQQLWSIAGYIDSEFEDTAEKSFLTLGLLSIMEDVSQIRKHGSHYRFMLKTESIGLQKLNTPIIAPSTDILPILRARLEEMVEDITEIKKPIPSVSCNIKLTDARSCGLEAESVSVVITSPPYLNRNNYIAQQKAELAMLSLVTTSKQYRKLVQSTIRSHVEGLFKAGIPESALSEVQVLVEALCLTENNNAKIPHMIAAYFEDLTAVFHELWRVMRKGAKAAFVVGNSRWGGVVIPVDHILLKIAEEIGFKPERILVTRLKGNSPQQMRQYGRIAVRESIIIFSKP